MPIMVFDVFGQCYERQVSTEYSRVNHKKVQRLMHEINIQGAGYRKKKAKFNFYPGPNDQTTKPNLAFNLGPVQELVAKLSKRHYQTYLHTDQT